MNTITVRSPKSLSASIDAKSRRRKLSKSDLVLIGADGPQETGL